MSSVYWPLQLGMVISQSNDILWRALASQSFETQIDHLRNDATCQVRVASVRAGCGLPDFVPFQPILRG